VLAGPYAAWKEMIENGYILGGSAETVRQQLEELSDTS